MGLMEKQKELRLWPDLAKPRERVGRGTLLYYFEPEAPPQKPVQ